jgi:rhamnose utilization protein RhaD (predicted bifunctional aldolase and dehydrogenase)
MSDLLPTLADLSHEFGTETYVRGGGGNTSAKDEATLWVKPSGTTLAGMEPDRFVALNRAGIDRLFETRPPVEPSAREARVKEIMMAAVRTGSSGRPSVEAPLHHALDGVYVVHTHPTAVNAMTCGAEGKKYCRDLFPDALWFDYIDPGYTLCIEVRDALVSWKKKTGRQPEVLFLKNHGVFVSADSPERIRDLYRHILRSVREAIREAGVDEEAWTVGAPPEERAVAETARCLRDALGDQAAAIASSGPHDVLDGPLTPDHIVYARSFPYRGPLTRAGLEAYIATHGFPPRVVVTDDGVYGIGPHPAAAERALEFSRDASRIVRLADAFGGVERMTDRAREFIENWEVESYRQQVADGG